MSGGFKKAYGNISTDIGEIIRIDNRSVRLCCNKKNCPTVTDLGNGVIQILDDDGKTVTMKREEAEMYLTV